MGAWRAWSARPKRVRENLPLSPNEERYVLAESMTGQVYVSPSAMRIRGQVDMDRMEAALRATCDRHEARRTGFEPAPGGGFTKYILDRAQVHVKRLSMPGASDDELKDAIRKHIYQKGDFSPETLHRYIFIQLAPQDWVVAHAHHHATSDGVTGSSFLVEMFSRVFGFPVEAEGPQYSDFWDFDWRNSDAYRTAGDFWIERLAGLESGGVLPPDRRASAPMQARPGAFLPIPPEIADSTRRAAEALGVTHFTFFYAAYLVLLARLTGEARVCTTFQSAGRRGKPGAEAAHGVFSNSLILGVRVDEAESVRTLAGRLRVEIREAIAHEIFPYHHVIRATGVHPRYAINWYPPSPTGEVQGVTFEGLDLIENQDDDDLNLRIHTYGEAMSLAAFYDATQFSAARVEAIAGQLLTLAHALAQAPDLPIRETSSRTLAAPGQLPDPAAALPEGDGQRIFDGFLRHAREAPERTALVSTGQTLSYGELEQASRGLALALREKGVRAGDHVAILGERDPRLVAAMLAAARCGAVFSVFDAAYPEAHLAGLAKVVVPRAVLWAGDERLAGLAERLAAPTKAVTLAANLNIAASADLGDLDQARAQDPAYVVFTSGTTGRPKAVANSHRPLAHFLAWQAQTFALRPEERFGLLSGLSHDPVLRDVFAPLSLGAALAIPDVELAQPGALSDWLRRERVTVAHITPPLGQALLAGRGGELPDLRWVFWGGDLLRPSLANLLAERAPNARQVNFYGATETPQAVAFHEIGTGLDADLASVPIGRGAAGAQLLVVGADGAQVGPGELGDIAVRSNLLGLGYVERGAIRLPDDRLPDGLGRPSVYRTGDRGFALPDGPVMVVGRGDDQVKVRGHRVELAEVVAALEALPMVRAAAVLPVGAPESTRLAAFVSGPRDLDPETVRASLAARLPAHMVPGDVIRLDAMPLSPNGKVRRDLLAAELTARSSALPQAPQNELERALMEGWGAALARKVDSRDASFASLGGDSLSYVQAYLVLEERIGEPPEDWQLMTIAELAARKPAAAGALARVDASIVVRAAAISLVVAGHLQLFRFAGGATTALFLVSGYLFGGLQLAEVYAQRTAQPVVRWLLRLLTPTMVLSAAIFASRAVEGKSPELSTLLLTADLQDYAHLPAPYRGGHELYLWFIDCQLQILAFLLVATVVMLRLKVKRLGAWAFGATLFALGCLGRFTAPLLVFGLGGVGHARPTSFVDFAPTTHLGTVALGIMVATASTRHQRLWTGGLLVIYGLASTPFYGLPEALFLFGAGAALMANGHAVLPRPVAVVVTQIAAASLFIYLTHYMTRAGLRRLHLPEWPLLFVVMALAAGVLFARGWLVAATRLGRLARRPPAGEPQIAPI